MLWDRSARAVVSRIAYPEIRAALAAAERTHRIDASQLRVAVVEADRRFGELTIMDIDTPIAHAAGDLAETFGLRGYDAVHLASAVAVAPDFLATWDSDLAAAAISCGLRVAPAGG